MCSKTSCFPLLEPTAFAAKAWMVRYGLIESRNAHLPVALMASEVPGASSGNLAWLAKSAAASAWLLRSGPITKIASSSRTNFAILSATSLGVPASSRERSERRTSPNLPPSSAISSASTAPLRMERPICACGPVTGATTPTTYSACTAIGSAASTTANKTPSGNCFFICAPVAAAAQNAHARAPQTHRLLRPAARSGHPWESGCR